MLDSGVESGSNLFKISVPPGFNPTFGSNITSYAHMHVLSDRVFFVRLFVIRICAKSSLCISDLR